MKNVMFGGFHGNPNIGLYGFANDQFCLLGKEVPTHIAEQIGKALEVPVIQMNIGGTSLLGVFIAGNEKGIIVPEIAFESELKILHQHKIKYEVIDTDFTALGNNVVCNDQIGFVNPDYGVKAIKQMETALGVKLTPIEIATMPMVGSLLVVNQNGGLIHSEATEADIKAVSKITKGDILQATLNFGNPYVRSGILVNSKGLVIGSKSTGVEVSDAETAFGMI